AEHLRWAERADRLGRDVERLEGRIKGRTESLARQFDRVLRVLEAWGYVDGWSLGEAGSLLASTYSESDLLVCESVREGLLAGLDAPSVAALASCFTYETRGPAGTAPSAPSRWPSGKLRDRFLRIERIWRDLEAAERDAGLPSTRSPDPGFIVSAHRWASGRDLEDVLEGAELTGGDFVRNTKQLIDLLRQLAEVAPDQATGAAARLAVRSLFRGVVAASGTVN
ncbi:MAG: DEAD/DEAH box helicase, partial [Acidimicrobiia bacterium]